MQRKLSRLLKGSVVRMGATLALGFGLSLAWAPAAQAAGNVTVIVDEDGNLIVTGDDASNCVEISPFDTGEGNVDGCDSTLVNGGAFAPFSGANNDFRFIMGGGDDTVIVDDGDGDTAPDDLEIDTGSGNDTVRVHRFAVLDDMEILTGSGNDLVVIDEVAVHDSTRIVTGSGTDCTVFGVLTPATATECPVAP